MIKYKYKIPAYSKEHWSSREFFELFKLKFLESTPIEIIFKTDTQHLGYNNYVKELYDFFKEEYYINKNLDVFEKYYNQIKSSYSGYFRWIFYEDFVDFLIEIGEYQKAYNEWIALQEEERGSLNVQFTYRNSAINRLIYFEGLFKKSLINGYHIHKIAPKGSQLTEFGKRNIDEVFLTVNTIIEKTNQNSFFENFYTNYEFDSNLELKTFPAEYYFKFFQHNKKSKKNWDWFISNSGETNTNLKFIDGNASHQFVMMAIREEASRLLRESENSYRNSIGAKDIGEAWISETELFYKLKNHFIEFEVVQHGRPDWLGRQHVDIWFHEHSIGIEYQGQQHDRPIEFFGGEKSFEEGKKRDERKRMLFKENNAFLIEVREGFDFELLCEEIKSCIKIAE